MGADEIAALPDALAQQPCSDNRDHISFRFDARRAVATDHLDNDLAILRPNEMRLL